HATHRGVGFYNIHPIAPRGNLFREYPGTRGNVSDSKAGCNRNSFMEEMQKYLRIAWPELVVVLGPLGKPLYTVLLHKSDFELDSFDWLSREVKVHKSCDKSGP